MTYERWDLGSEAQCLVNSIAVHRLSTAKYQCASLFDRCLTRATVHANCISAYSITFCTHLKDVYLLDKAARTRTFAQVLECCQ